MQKKLGKEVYRIYKKLMYEKDCRHIALRHIEAGDQVQGMSEEFSKEQWHAIEAYQTAMMELCNLMVATALKKK